MNIITLTQNQILKVAKYRDKKNLTISYEDKEILGEMNIGSFVGVIEIKNSFLIEILPNFENSNLNNNINNKILNYREKLLNIILLLNSNLNNPNYIFSKNDLIKLPLNEALIYLILNTLSNELINIKDNLYFKSYNHTISLSLKIFKCAISLSSILQ